MLGLEGLCQAFYDDPAFVERMMEERAEAIITITAEVLKHTPVDAFWYWEDMAYNHASLIDPRMYRAFALKHYRRVNDWLRAQGIRHIGLDSDGNISELIPIWIDAGHHPAVAVRGAVGHGRAGSPKEVRSEPRHDRRHRQAGAHPG